LAVGEGAWADQDEAAQAAAVVLEAVASVGV
jgi:hypothetical protein